MKTILLLTSWSTGSTSVSGFLNHCGAYSCPPYFMTNDNNTPNSYESLEYKKALSECIDEVTLKQHGNIEKFKSFFQPWIEEQMMLAKKNEKKFIVLKHPLQIFLLSTIQLIIDPILIVITRPYENIEKTRIRRGWPEIYGQKGAHIIYNYVYGYLHANSYPYFVVPFEKFRKDDNLQKQLLNFCEIRPKDDDINKAKEWLRPF
jgi:hypothetical protein